MCKYLFHLECIIFFLHINCFDSLEECRNTLVQFGVRELTAAAIARTLGMMADTAVGLTTPDQIPVQVTLQPLCKGLSH